MVNYVQKLNIPLIRIIFWIEGITEHGYKSLHKDKLYPVEFLMNIGVVSQKSLIDATLEEFAKETNCSVVIESGITIKILNSTEDLEIDLTLFEPRLKQICNWF